MSKQTVILSTPSAAKINAARIDVTLLGSITEFAEELQQNQTHTFIGWEADISMDKKGKMNKTGNPFIGKGMIRRVKAQGTVNFDYEKKREARGGEAPAKPGFVWHTPVMLNGKITPLSVHKADVVTTDAKSLNERKAILDDEGNTQFIVDDPRLYLRYEVVREGGEGERSERPMRYEGEYLLNGEVIADEDVKPFLPKKDRKDGTDVQTLTLSEVTRLSIGGKVYRRAIIG